MKRFSLFSLITVFGVEVLAQAVPAAPAQGQWIVDLAKSHPWIIGVLSVMGLLRLLLKPLFAFLHKFFQDAGLVAWDQKETALEQSKPVQALLFVLDYLGSIKVPVPAQPEVSTDAPKAS